MRLLPLLILASTLCLAAHGHAQRQPAVPYVSTPYDVVDKMLEMAKVGPADGRIIYLWTITEKQKRGVGK